MNARHARRLVELACFLATCPAAAPAAAGTGTQLRTPGPPKTHTNGLQINLDCDWVEGYGYRPMQVEINSNPIGAVDRTVTVELSLSYRPDRAVSTVSEDIVVPAGAATVSQAIAVPQLGTMQFVSMRIWDHGDFVEELSFENQLLNNSAGMWWNVPRLLFVTDQPVDISKLGFLVGGHFANNPVLASARQISTVVERLPARVPDNWLHYTALDVTFISLADLRELAAKRPEAQRALVRWAHSGGNLCVFGAGGDFAGLTEIEQLTGCPATDKESQAPARGWARPETDLFEKQVVPLVENERAMADQSNAAPQTAPAPAIKPPPTGDFRWKQAGFGQVAALAEAQPFPGDDLAWRWLFQSLDRQRISWPLRHGTAPDQENLQFNDFLIADVGLPPIRAYRVLISLFVVAIGPVNYWLLRRWRRLHLFLFTVPLAALLTSGALLGYALVSDGLQTRMRTRSLTLLDQPRGEAVSYARLSYYLGLAPSGGMQFPRDTAVYPLDLDPTASRNSTRTRRIAWDDRQRLTQGWIAARTPTQLVTTDANRTERKLVLLPAGDPTKVTIENRLGTTVRALVWCDKGGQCFGGPQIEPAQRGVLAPMAEADLLAFSRALAHDEPAVPDAMLSAGSRGGLMFFGRRRHYYYGGQNAPIISSQSALETGIVRLRADIVSGSLPPKSYVAIVDRPAEVATGVSGASESPGLHVIEGRW